MPSTTTYSRGDIVLVSFPFTDLTSTKRRPALVISPDPFNQLNQDLILAAISSQISTAGSYSVQVGPNDCENGALPKVSVIKLTKVFTMSCALVVKTLCRLNDRKFVETLLSLRNLYS